MNELQILAQQLKEILGEESVLCREPMRRHCSFQCGGPADLLVYVSELDALRKAIALLQAAGEPFYILGRGTNLLVADKGYRGCIITMTRRGSLPLTDTTALAAAADEDGSAPLYAVRTDGCRVIAGAGASLSAAAGAAYRNGLGGLAFAAGIPGSVGGGLVMNAGAYGGEMKQVVEQGQILMPDGTLKAFSKDEMEFGYRTSILKTNGGVAVGAVFSLQKEDPAEIAAQMADFANRRRSKQPLEYPSAGSTFKRPEGYFAGKLISDAGLRGFTIGGAQVSDKHAGFVINKNGASAADVRAVIEAVQQKVMETAGVRLEREVIFLGDF